MCREVWQRGLAVKRSGSRDGKAVLTTDFASYMLDQFYWSICQWGLKSPHTVGEERDPTLELAVWFQKIIETTPVAPHGITISGRPYNLRTTPNIDGEPNWVARDVFAALKAMDQFTTVISQIPGEFKFVEPLRQHPGTRPELDLCLTWKGLDMALGLIKTSAAQEFDSWVRTEFSGRFPQMFQGVAEVGL
jgi:hypothetical protein